MKVRGKIKNGEVQFSSPLAKRIFVEKNEGQDILIEVDDAPTANSRRYFEGAVVPAIFYQHPKAGWSDFRDAREALKLEFLWGYTLDLSGIRTKYARSTTDLTKEKFFQFLENVTRWMEQNGLEVPDPEEYKAWRDSAPAANETYPPLARMKATYDEVKYRDKPWLIRNKK